VIYLDNQEVEFHADSIGSAITTATDVLGGQGRVVVEVRLGDRLLTGLDLTGSQTRPIGSDDLWLYSANPKNLAMDTLVQVRAQLNEAPGVLQQAADLLQRDQANEAMAQVSDMIGLWLATQQAVQRSAALMGVDLDQVSVGDQTVGLLARELVGHLHTLKQVLEDRDTVALADMLAYEWPGQMQKWGQLVNTLSGQIEQIT